MGCLKWELRKVFPEKKHCLKVKNSIPPLLVISKKNPSINFHQINSIINKETLLLITNIDGIIVYLNEKCSASLGYQPEELVGKHTRIFKTGIHTTEFYQTLWRQLLSGESWKGEITTRRKNGSAAWFFMSIFPLLDESNHPYQFLTIRTDITDLKKKEKQALLTKKQLDSFIGILPNAVIGCIDRDGKIIYLSPAVEEVLGYKVSERIGLSVYEHIESETLPKFRSSIEELGKTPGSYQTIEVRFRSKNGSIHSCEFIAKNYLNDPLLKAIVFTYRDVTEEKRFEQELKKIAYCDLLTGLPNYRYFADCLNQEIEQAKERNTNLAVIQLGIDDFKYVNSTLGHPAGDRLLKDFSERIKNVLPENISMYRMCGDIFILLMKDILDMEEIQVTLSRFISLLNKKPFQIDENQIYVFASLGVSIFPYSGENTEVLVKNAEAAMFRAKSNGKNQYQIFSPTMSLYSYKQFILRNDLKQALLRNEFSLYYQPRINSVTNEMVSAEVLIRWNHPKWGLVLPDEFISMAEESGLIVSIGEWIIRKAFSELKKWEKENLPIKKLSINLSSLQLLQPQFVDMVSSSLKERSIDPNWIEFEITETVILTKEEEVLKILNHLKNWGITFALDDFGTGYSSLNYLKKFPFDVIKIDKSLIKDIDQDKDNYEIVASIISLCHKLTKIVVAEGVETDKQLLMLHHLGCDEIQGYLYSKPVDEQEYSKFLKEGIGNRADKPSMHPYVNRRKYFRIHLEIPLVADMTIERIGNRRINIGSTEVMIKNIGPGGLCFYSPLKVPVSKDIILQFTTEILAEVLKLIGHVVWYKETESNYYQYGVELILSEIEQENLVKILNNFQVKLRHNSFLPDCRLYTN